MNQGLTLFNLTLTPDSVLSELNFELTPSTHAFHPVFLVSFRGSLMGFQPGNLKDFRTPLCKFEFCVKIEVLLNNRWMVREIS